MSRAERITPDRTAGAPTPRPAPERVRQLAGQVKPLALAGELTLPVLPSLAALLPAGLRRGSTVVVTGTGRGADRRPQGATSLALALAARASAGGSWSAAIAFPDLGLLAAAELGIDMARMALIPDVPPAHWVNVAAAMIDAVDIVVGRPPAHLKPGDARRLTTRTRERGAILIPVLLDATSGPWAEGADVRLALSDARWGGPGAGDGRLSERELTVTAGGRGAAARERVVRLSLPAPMENTAFAGSDADRIPDRALDQARPDGAARPDPATAPERAAG
ncbi:MAG: hypothetical protein NVS1B12_07450 [Acidimicrobiales bacterium]